MAITSTLVGSLGASTPTESRFWFSNSRRYCSDLNKDWAIPAGRHLFMWQGRKSNALVGTVTIGGNTFDLGSSLGERGGYFVVEGPTTVLATGTGTGAFAEDPYVTWVKIAG